MRLSKKEEYLQDKDKKLKKIIDNNGHIKFKPNKENEFNHLFEIVVSQFISTSAANSIIINIKDSFNKDVLCANDFEELSIFQIKKLGLSTNKARTIKELSDKYIKKTFTNLTKLNNEILDEKLLNVFGIGPWSVCMFEIFCIGKLDIFSSSDAGLRLAMNKAKMIKQDSEWKLYDEYAEKWSPYRSIASLHLWKTVD